MDRLRGFDYKRPFFYMVTLKRLLNLADFSQISDETELPKDLHGQLQNHAEQSGISLSEA